MASVQPGQSIWRSALLWGLGVVILTGLAWGSFLAGPVIAIPTPESQSQSQSRSSLYTYRDRPSSDGIGKVYLGREIAKVMGYEGAGWLERRGRENQEQPSVAIAALNLKPDDVVADIGAGTGYFSTRLAPLVPQGKVLAVDVQPEMIDILHWMKGEYQLDNLIPVLADEQDPHLPERGVDVVLMVDVYHELAYPHEVMEKIVQSLKPGGRVIALEYRAENPFILIKRHHKMSLAQLRREMATVSLTLSASPKILPQQHYAVFSQNIKE